MELIISPQPFTEHTINPLNPGNNQTAFPLRARHGGYDRITLDNILKALTPSINSLTEAKKFRQGSEAMNTSCLLYKPPSFENPLVDEYQREEEDIEMMMM